MKSPSTTIQSFPQNRYFCFSLLKLNMKLPFVYLNGYPGVGKLAVARELRL